MGEDTRDLETQLEHLENEEREISLRRSRLHAQLANFPNELLVQQEREISQRRRELHEQIDALRIQIRMARG